MGVFPSKIPATVQTVGRWLVFLTDNQTGKRSELVWSGASKVEAWDIAEGLARGYQRSSHVVVFSPSRHRYTLQCNGVPTV